MRWFNFFDISGIREHLGCHGSSYKKTYLLCQTSYSQADQPTSVGSLELVGANLGLHIHYEAEF